MGNREGTVSLTVRPSKYVTLSELLERDVLRSGTDLDLINLPPKFQGRERLLTEC